MGKSTPSVWLSWNERARQSAAKHVWDSRVHESHRISSRKLAWVFYRSPAVGGCGYVDPGPVDLYIKDLLIGMSLDFSKN